LLLLVLGLIYLAVSVGICSEHPLVVLTRRELASYFTSPVAYLVLFGMGFVAAIGYVQLLSRLTDPRSVADILEPIVRDYFAFDIGGAIAVLVLVPAVTMRAFSEEKRTGTLEVLMTAPVGEATVVVSKFLACLIFYMATWIPAGLFLVGLWVGGGQPFEYKPVLGYYLAVLACGCSFIGLGVFFSSLTRNQIVAAVLTFAVLFFMLLTVIRPIFQAAIGPELVPILRWVDYLGLWRQALNGQLPVPELVAQVSLGAFWVLLTIKVLEARKWN
jgi:ABC-type transport system involved in multi-copper enzyme maturation permease subunit